MEYIYTLTYIYVLQRGTLIYVIGGLQGWMWYWHNIYSRSHTIFNELHNPTYNIHKFLMSVCFNHKHKFVSTAWALLKLCDDHAYKNAWLCTDMSILVQTLLITSGTLLCILRERWSMAICHTVSLLTVLWRTTLIGMFLGIGFDQSCSKFCL